MLVHAQLHIIILSFPFDPRFMLDVCILSEYQAFIVFHIFFNNSHEDI
jgi:hypothetical protein